MQNSRVLVPSSLLNHLTTIKLALELLERERALSCKQQGLVQLALDAAAEMAVELANC
jgi:hypothetical protein